MEQAMEDRVHRIVQEKMDALMPHLVNVKFCAERHDAVDAATREAKDRIKSLDYKVWGLVLLGIAQLGTLVALLLRSPPLK